jgi:ATP-dependent Clp protease ATP-binding subunit ClpC
VIRPEHLLLALLPAGAAEVVRAELVPGAQPSPQHLPFSAEAGEAVVRAAGEARRLGDDRIGRDHLLLGLLRAGDDPAVRRLAAAGVDYASAYAGIVRRRAG